MSASTTTLPDQRTEPSTDFAHILGDELRQVRRQHRWSRKELRRRLEQPVSLPTLASYELGTRHCSVDRFVDICEALEIDAPELLRRALRRLASTAQFGCLHVDLRPVIGDNSHTLRAFRRWAEHRLATTIGPDTGIHLAPPAVEHLAELCDISTPDLVATLATLGAIRDD